MQRGTDAPESSRRTVTVWLAIVVAIAGFVRLWGLGFGLPHTNTRPDETIIIDVALSFLRGNFRPSFFDYPWLYMWVITGLYLLYYVWGAFTGMFHSVADLVASWRVHWVPFFMIPRALSAIVGTATVLVVFRIARNLWDDTTALVAALFMGLAFLHVRDSHYGTTDVAMTFLLTLSIAFLIDGYLKGRSRDFVVGGLFGGLAAATKYNALLLVVPLTAGYLLNVFEARDHRARAVLDPRPLFYGIPFLMAFAIGVPFLAFDLPKFRNEMQLLKESMEIGSRGLELSHGWIHHLEYSLRYGLGAPLLVAGIAGMFAILARDRRPGVLLLSFPIAYYGVAGSVRNLFFRYAIPLLPFLCIAAARLITWTAPTFGNYIALRFNRPQLASSLTRFAVAAVAAVIILPSAISTVRFDRILSQTDNRVIVARWFDQNVPAGSSVLISGSFYGYVQLTRDMNYEAWVWDRTRQIFVTDLDRRPVVGRPGWILVQESPLPSETQPLVLDLLNQDYVFVKHFPAFSPAEPHVFDQQDAFFAPFAGFRGVERPGPNYSLYKRIGAS